MAKKVSLFKNTYVIDMRAVREHPVQWTENGAILPIESINGAAPTTPEESIKLFAERPVRRMLEQYSVLFPMVNKAAQTITEYVDLGGKPLITLYPNNDVYKNNDDWQLYLGRVAMEDLRRIYEKQKRNMEGVAGALRQLKK